ncbi:MAG TPA: NAD(P)-dependent alcohol dehydrogenase [Arsenicitalea sp.]|jgi:NADPH:quinone reductase-like Zn-dependent oxidoreductase|nr:NAD(P)-dependent alcohol dehydrogenase [Arsenicitalea sp.]
MKAIVYHRYGPPDVVALAEVPKPTPKPNEVLVRILATTVTSGDWRARSLEMPAGFGLLGRLVFGIFAPRRPILGTELAGIVESTGRAVTRFKPGDEVFAFPSGSFGSHAEYRTMPEDGMIALKPSNLSFEEAAALPFGGTTAIDFLRRAGIRRGDNVLIVGASGSVGSAAVQISKHFGAMVTGVSSAANADLVRSLGADAVVDYSKEDFTRNGESYDIILDTTGSAPFSRVEPVLKAGGRLAAVLATLSLNPPRPSRASGKKIIAGVAALRPDDMQTLAKLAQAGEFRPVIDRSYPLEQAAKAHAYVDSGRKRGNVVLTVGQSRAEKQD